MCLADLCVTASSIRFRKEKTRQITQPAQPTRCHRKYGSHFHLNSPTDKRFHMRLYFQSKVGLKVKFMICFAACAFTAYIMCVFFPFFFFPHKLLAVTPSFMLCFPVETQHLHFMSPLTFFFLLLLPLLLRRGVDLSLGWFTGPVISMQAGGWNSVPVPMNIYMAVNRWREV